MKIAMISSWHVHAKDYAKMLLQLPQCEIVAVWDENKEAGLKWSEELNCRFIEDYDTLLQDNTIDGVVINAPTKMHGTLIVKAANAKKHIFTEKVLALTVEECLEIKEAIEKNGVKFGIGFAHMSHSHLLKAKSIVDEGLLGDITYARVRNVHNGSLADWLPQSFYNKEDCGGGAMIDLGAHPLYLLEWILGQAKKVSATFTHVTHREVEDNAVCVLEFDNGAIGVAETGFVSVNMPFTLDISGTKGSLLIRNGLSMVNEATDGKWVAVEDLPEALPNPLIQWVEGVVDNKKIHATIDQAIALTSVLEAAYKSHESGLKILI